jgi:carbonic anhydrase
MSCSAPIDISTQNASGKCDLKCAFSYKYAYNSAVATNRKNYISLLIDKQSGVLPVTFNTTKYYVSEVRVFQPSLHSYNGSKKDAELIIVHQSENSDNYPLLVCIPITGTAYDASESLEKIIETVSSNAPGESNKTTIKSFSIGDWLPDKSTPFYTYEATLPYQPCAGTVVNYVVYTTPVSIRVAKLKILKQIVKENNYSVQEGVDYYVNDSGANSTTDESEIYIDCQPTWVSDETVVESSSSSNQIDINDIYKSDAFKFIMIGLFYALIVVFFYYGIKMIFEKKVGGSESPYLDNSANN